MARKRAIKADSTERGSNKKHSMRDNVLKGATVLAVTAGTVALGTALSNKDTRKKLGHTTGKAFGKVRDFAYSALDEGQNRYQVVAHNIPGVKNKRGRKANSGNNKRNK